MGKLEKKQKDILFRQWTDPVAGKKNFSITGSRVQHLYLQKCFEKCLRNKADKDGNAHINEKLIKILIVNTADAFSLKLL